MITGVLKLLVQDAVNYLISMGILGLWVFWVWVFWAWVFCPATVILRQLHFLTQLYPYRISLMTFFSLGKSS